MAWECGRLETANTVTRPPLIIATVNTVRLHTNSHRAVSGGISVANASCGLDSSPRFQKSNKKRAFSNVTEFLDAEKINLGGRSMSLPRAVIRLQHDNPVRPLQETPPEQL